MATIGPTTGQLVATDRDLISVNWAFDNVAGVGNEWKLQLPTSYQALRLVGGYVGANQCATLSTRTQRARLFAQTILGSRDLGVSILTSEFAETADANINALVVPLPFTMRPGVHQLALEIPELDTDATPTGDYVANLVFQVWNVGGG